MLALGVVATLSLIHPPRALVEAADDFWLHSFAYAVLALLVAQGWPQHRRGLWIFLFLFGLGVEVLQDQTGYGVALGRGPDRIIRISRDGVS